MAAWCGLSQILAGAERVYTRRQTSYSEGTWIWRGLHRFSSAFYSTPSTQVKLIYFWMYYVHVIYMVLYVLILMCTLICLRCYSSTGSRWAPSSRLAAGQLPFLHSDTSERRMLRNTRSSHKGRCICHRKRCQVWRQWGESGLSSVGLPHR